MSRGGDIQLILGPMFSGKTTELIRRIRRLKIAQRKCLVIKYAGDTRYSEQDASTHDRQTIEATGCLALREADSELVANADVLGIDEGQFFPDLLQFCETMADRGKTVIVAALSGTFERKAFGQVMELVPKAEKVDLLNAICKFCQSDAAFSARLGSETQVQVIGGLEKYASACRKCFKVRSYHSPARKVNKRGATQTVDQGVAKRLAFTGERSKVPVMEPAAESIKLPSCPSSAAPSISSSSSTPSTPFPSIKAKAPVVLSLETPSPHRLPVTMAL